MSAAKVEISLSAGGFGKVIINGAEMQNVVTALHFDRSADGTQRLVLDLIPGETAISTEADVVVDAKTREALTALGWTPPGDAP